MFIELNLILLGDLKLLDFQFEQRALPTQINFRPKIETFSMFNKLQIICFIAVLVC